MPIPNPISAGEPIRLTHCIGTMRIGGAEKQLCELICGLPRDKFRQSLVLLQGGGPLVKRVKAAGCEVVTLGYKMQYRKWDPRCYWAMFQALRRYLRHLWIFRPHILHAQLYWANIISVVAGRIARVPIIITSRLQLSNYKFGRPTLQKIENWANRHTTAIFANSEAVRRDAMEHEIVDEKKLHVIYNGVVLDEYEEVDPTRTREELQLKPGEIVIMAVANLHPYKGHADLITAIGELAGKYKNLRVFLPGRDQGARHDLESLIEKLGLIHQVRLLGERQDIPQLLSLADIVVHPSHQEGFSNSILEAMIAGKPLIVTDVGGNPEAVEDGVNGLLVPPADPARMAAAIKTLIKDPELRHQMGISSREKIQNEFSMFKMIRQFVQWYESLVGQNLK